MANDIPIAPFSPAKVSTITSLPGKAISQVPKIVHEGSNRNEPREDDNDIDVYGDDEFFAQIDRTFLNFY